jgi:hypothetical protein
MGNAPDVLVSSMLCEGSKKIRDGVVRYVTGGRRPMTKLTAAKIKNTTNST